MRTFATVENCIVANFEKESSKLEVISSTMGIEITEKQKARLKEGLIEWGDDQNGFKYYLLDEHEFHDTNFSKKSKGGIQGFRYKDLREFLGNEQLNDKSTKEIADLLKDKEWH